ncbi:MAG: arylsulfatase [Tannerella sp.]|jgi:arylsulfatase B|nr:arylsulfatase [Tannerella sp.]
MKIFLKSIGMTLACASLAATAQTKPNVVIILADDLGWGDVGFHGSDIATPNLDRLAAKGIQLDRFYTAPVSSPTRAGLMTGRYPSRFGIRKTVIPPWREYGLDETEETLADMLGKEGYANRAMIGKWHLGHARRAYYPLNRGFTYFYGHLNGAIDYFTHFRDGELDWHKNWESCYDEGYSTDLLSDEAVKFINQQRADSPYLLYLAYNAPHGPLMAKPEDIAVYAANPKFAKDGNNLTKAELRNCTYAAMVTCMDRGIGKVYEALEQSGQLDNTIVLFFSDNGPAGEGSALPHRGRKFQEWDGGVRAPAFILWKNGLKEQRIVDQVTGYIDVLPTLRDILGVKSSPQKELDGISVYPVLKGERDSIERDLYLGCGTIVNQDYKLILPGQNPQMKMVKEDFFISYKDDPYENENSKDANPQEMARLKKLVLEYDAIPAAVDESNYDEGREGFKPPHEWKVIKP